MMNVPSLKIKNKTSQYQDNFLYQGPKLWNQILPFIRILLIRNVNLVPCFRKSAELVSAVVHALAGRAVLLV